MTDTSERNQKPNSKRIGYVVNGSLSVLYLFILALIFLYANKSSLNSSVVLFLISVLEYLDGGRAYEKFGDITGWHVHIIKIQMIITVVFSIAAWITIREIYLDKSKNEKNFFKHIANSDVSVRLALAALIAQIPMYISTPIFTMTSVNINNGNETSILVVYVVVSLAASILNPIFSYYVFHKN